MILKILRHFLKQTEKKQKERKKENRKKEINHRLVKR